MFEEEAIRLKNDLPSSGKQTMTMQFIYNFFIKHKMKGITDSVDESKTLSSHVYAFFLTCEKDDKYEISIFDEFSLDKDGARDPYKPIIFERIVRHGDAFYNEEINDYVINPDYNENIELANEITGDTYYEFLLERLHVFFDSYYTKSFEEIIDENLHKISLW